MQKIFITAACLLAAFSAPCSFSEEEQREQCLFFDQALRTASLESPERALARAELEGAKANAMEAASLTRPQVSTFVRSASGDPGLVDSQFGNQIGLRGSQRLFDFGDSRRAREAADKRVETKTHHVRSAMEGAILNTGFQFMTWLEAHELLSIVSDKLQYFKQKKALLEHSVLSGGTTAMELAEVNAELAIAEAEALDLRFRQKNAEASLKRQLGISGIPCEQSLAPINILLKDIPGDRSIDDWIALAHRNNPTTLALRSDASSFEIEALRERRARLPKIDLVGIVSYAGDTEFDDFEYRDRIGIDVSVPILSGSAIDARANEAKSRAAQAKNHLNIQERDLTAQIESAYHGVLITEAQLGRRGAILKARQDEFEAIQAGFDAALKTQSEQIEARLKFDAALIHLTQTEVELLRTKLRLLWLAGKLSEFSEPGWEEIDAAPQ